MTRSRMFLALALLLAALPLSPVSAADPEPVAWVNAVIHPVSGPVIAKGAIVVTGDRITACGEMSVADGIARRVDLGGLHVWPGLVAAESVLGLHEIGSLEETVDTNETGEFNPNARAESSVNPDSELIPVARARGVLTALSAPKGGRIGGTSALLRLAGRSWEEMTLAAPVGLHVRWPAFPGPRLDKDREKEKKSSGGKERDDEERLREELRDLDEMFSRARGYLAAREAAAARKPGVPPLKTDRRLEAMIPVVTGKTPVIVRADAVAQIRSAVLWAEEAKLRLVILGGRDAWRIAPFLAERKVPVIWTGSDDLPDHADLGYDANFAAAARLHEAGVPFAIALDGAGSNAGNLAHVAALAAAYGLPADEAVRAVTIHPARILGIADRLGSLEPGKLATFIVTDGDILDIRTRVTRAVIDGKEIDLASRHTRLYERHAPKR